MLNRMEIERLDAEAVNSARVRRPLYEPRKKIFPKRVTGTFRRFKWLVMAITLGIYYLTPWIRWDRGPHAPDQDVLVDLANRRLYFFADARRRPATVRRGPRRVRAFVRVRCPRTGRPRRCRSPR